MVDKEVTAELESIIASGFEEAQRSANEIWREYERMLLDRDRVATRLERQLKTSDEEVERLEEQYEKLEREIFDRDSASSDNLDRVQAYKNQIQEKDAQMAGLQARLELSEKGRKESSDAADRAWSSLKKSEESAKALNRQIAELMSQNMTTTSSLADATSTGFQASLTGLALDAQAKQLKDENGRLQSQVAELQTRVAKEKAEFQQKKTELDQAVSVVSQSERQLSRELLEKESELRSLKASKTDLERRLREANEKATETQERLEREVREHQEIARLKQAALTDAEAQVKEMATFSAAVAHEYKEQVTEVDPVSDRPARRRKIGTADDEQPMVVPAEDVLLVVQSELQGKAQELEQQAEEYQRAVNSEASLRVELEETRRQRDGAAAQAEAAQTAAEKAERKALEIRRRNVDLERRLLLATSAGSPKEHDDSRTPGATSNLGTPRTASSADIKSAQKRQEELVTAIVAQRDLYRSMLLNSPFSPAKRK